MSSSNLLMQDVTVSSRSFFNFHSTFRGYPLALHSKVTLSPGFALTVFLSLSLNNGSTRIKVNGDNNDVTTTTITMMIILMMMMRIRRMFLPKMSKNIVGFSLTDLEKLLHFLDRFSPLRRGIKMCQQISILKFLTDLYSTNVSIKLKTNEKRDCLTVSPIWINMICFHLRKGLAIHEYWQATNSHTIRLCTLLTVNYNVI